MKCINESSIDEWQQSADLVVAGFGMAGACAALSAREQGGSVLVLERGSGVNGSATQAAGHFYLGGGTRPQLANGLEDTADEMYNYLHALTPEPEDEKIRLYCDDSVKHFNWLTEQGIPFNNGFYKRKHVEQPTDECLIWSGNEKVWPYSEQAQACPRGHKVAVEGSGGALAMQRLLEKAKSVGVSVAFDTAVHALVTNAEGRVVGVQCRRFGEEVNVSAKNGVLLATGGYVMNKDMLKEYTPGAMFEKFWPQGGANDDGSGIQLGLAAGGEAIRMERFFATSPIYPPEQLLKAIVVNKHGQRFINEDSYHARFARACLDQDDGIAYLICDNTVFARPEFQMQELIDAWETVAEMEEGLSLPPGSLQNTLDQYNEDADRGVDSVLHKHSDWLQALKEPPFGALQCSKGEATYTGFTLGGLKVSANAEVLTATDQPIAGLYAAGACASNIAQDSNGYSSGTCLGEASYFGRRAGHYSIRGEAMS
ncbi:MAG: FAD-binding protein [Pseudomonadales bacterium]